MRLPSLLKLFMVLCCTAIPGQAHTAAIFSFTQSGANLVGTLSGSLNLTGATDDGSTPSYGPRIEAGIGYLNASTGTCCSVIANEYAVSSGPSKFGTSDDDNGTSIGDLLEVDQFDIILSNTYAGGSLSNTTTFANTSLSALGITPGDYVYTLAGSGDTLTLRFSEPAATVPLPGTAWLAALALLLCMAASGRRPSAQAGATSVLP